MTMAAPAARAALVSSLTLASLVAPPLRTAAPPTTAFTRVARIGVAREL